MNATVKYYEDLSTDELMLVDGGDAESTASIMSSLAGTLGALVGAGVQVYAGLKQAVHDAGEASVYRAYLKEKGLL